MAKSINTANILAGFKKVEELAVQIDNAYDDVMDTSLITYAENNYYADNDNDESIQALADDIATNGLLNALVVRKVNNSDYVLISGERRYKAIQKLGWKKIRCRVFENLSEDKARLMLHTANLQTREYTAAQKLSFYEDCNNLLNRMKESGEYKGAIQEGIAKMLQVSKRQVRTYKTICENTSDEEREEIITGNVSLRQAYDKAASKKSGSDATLEKISLEPKLIKEAVKHSLRAEDVLLFYFLTVPTEKEAVKYLKGYYCDTEKNITYSDSTKGLISWNDSKVIVYAETGNEHLTYADIDTVIRKMIRTFELLSVEEVNKVLHSHFIQVQLAALDEKEKRG